MKTSRPTSPTAFDHGTRGKRPRFRAGDRVSLASHVRPIPAYGGKPFVGRDAVLRVSSVTGRGTLRDPWGVSVTDDAGNFWGLMPGDLVLADEGTARAHSTMRGGGESVIAFETDQHWVKRVPKGFEVYKTGLTHSTRVASIGYTGDKGLQRAKHEIERREGSLTRSHSTIRGSGEESFASVHRKAVRENLRTELNRALAEIWDATHVADYHSRIHAYGSESEMHNFAKGLSGVKVRPITAREQQELAKRKRQAYGNP